MTRESSNSRPSLRRAGIWAAVGGILAAGAVMCATPLKALAKEKAEKPNVVIMLAAGFPQIYNIEADPKERVDIGPTGGGWVTGPYLQTVMKYRETLKQYPNPPVPNVTRF